MTNRTKPSRSGLSRRDVLKTSGAAAGIIAASGLAAPAIVKAAGTQRFLRPLVAGLNARPGDPSYESIAQIPGILREKYDVELEIQLHPSSTLGTDLSQLDAVQTGFIDITSNSTAQLHSYSNAFEFVDLPYAITDWDMAERLFASELWAERKKTFNEESGLVSLPPVGAGGFRLLLNNQRPLADPSAVDGLKIRTTQASADIELIRAWGGNPTPLAWTETYNALRTRLVEGMHVQPIWTYGFNMFEVLNHGTEVDGIFAIQMQLLNRNTYASMPEVISDRFMKAAADAAIIGNRMDRDLESKMKDNLREKGLEIYSPSDAEKTQWRTLGEGLWPQLAADIDPSIIERMKALR